MIFLPTDAVLLSAGKILFKKKKFMYIGITSQYQLIKKNK